ASVALPLVGARRGLLLTTEHPSKARVRYGDRFDIVWVTDHPEPGTPTVRPKALDTEGRRAIANYASVHPGTDIVLVGLDQLAVHANIELDLLRALRRPGPRHAVRMDRGLLQGFYKSMQIVSFRSIGSN